MSFNVTIHLFGSGARGGDKRFPSAFQIFLLYHFSIRLRYNYLTASHAKTIKQHTLQYVTKSEIYGKDVDIPGNYQWTLLNLLLNTDVFFELYETFLIFGY